LITALPNSRKLEIGNMHSWPCKDSKESKILDKEYCTFTPKSFTNSISNDTASKGNLNCGISDELEI
jgi:hypothetical protein